MHKNINSNEAQVQLDDIDQKQNNSDDQQLDQENELPNHNKTKFLKVLSVTGLIAALTAAGTVTSVVKFCDPRSSIPDDGFNPTPINPDDGVNPSPTPGPGPTPDDGDSPTPNPQPNPDPDDKPGPEPSPAPGPTPDPGPEPRPEPQPRPEPPVPPTPDDPIQKLPDVDYMKFMWEQHFKDKRSSIETFKDVEENFKYFLIRTRPNIKIQDINISFNRVSNTDDKLGLDKDNHRMSVRFNNESFNLDIGKVNDSTKPIILKVIKSESDPADNGKIFSILNWEGTNNNKKIDPQKTSYEVLQIGYSKVGPSPEDKTVLEADIQIMKMPGQVQNVPPTLSKEITLLKEVFSDSRIDNQMTGIEQWNTSNIVSMQSAFKNSSFNGDLSNWDTSNVIDMSHMFANSSFNNQSITNWDTSKVFYMNHMFNNAKAFNQNINTKQVNVNGKNYNAWDTSSVRRINSMFESAEMFNQSIDKWNITWVEDITKLFKNAKKFNQDMITKKIKVGNKEYMTWDTARITSLEGMFWGATSFNGNIENWNTIKVENLDNIFRDAESFNRDISSDIQSTRMHPSLPKKDHYIAWEVKNVKTINFGFFNAKSFSKILKNWNVKKINEETKKGKKNTVSWDQGTKSWSRFDKPRIGKIY
ncbi:BspA family leucine-rich repeat surface protein [Mycoplasma putrefaciens]|uniref:PARCEL domain-containing protein n=1 Tax=Mycoplasma putrefaciens Mput9231 TaxID=1292033 RepID=M9WBT8_9MOLU|nr:BspA family leucine-rich repeat surface protein [Mycoplasma putrefaciens]AGJ90622.1 Hypothetical protein, predicted transmembrane protein, DUF285 family [Mycoplasma putrefaciens Mput9231]